MVDGCSADVVMVVLWSVVAVVGVPLVLVWSVVAVPQCDHDAGGTMEPGVPVGDRPMNARGLTHLVG